MKVKDLLEILADVNPECEIVISKDSEGNGFNPLEDINKDMMYDPEWDEIHYPKLTEELKELGYTEADCRRDGIPCIVFWP